MGRTPATETVIVKPENNIYTGLAMVGTLVVLAGLIVLYFRAITVLGPNGLLGQ